MVNTWLHLGLGSFHRAHQAYCFDALKKAGNADDWSFCAANIRDDAEATVQGLLKQDLKYTLETVSPEGQREFITIEALSEVIPYVEGLTPVIARGADPATKVISFTVTEAGYYLDDNLKLMQGQPSVACDLNGGTATIYGAVAAILDKRQKDHSGAVTLLCCDNVRDNGCKFKSGLTQFLTLKGRAELVEFLNNECTCPNTMVDRITPRPTAQVVADVKEYTGVDDAVPVMSESFFQWVVEDNFIAGRPSLEKAGVEMVHDVAPYEDAKLRLLNATHTCLALLGVIKGYDFVYECARDEQLSKLAYDYATLSVIPCIQGNGLNLEDYRDTVLSRFKNDNIRDTLQRICQDTFSKLTAFVKPTLDDCYQKGVDPKGVVLIDALYLYFLGMLFDGKVKFEYQDSSFDKEWAEMILASEDKVKAYCQTKMLFGDLTENPKFEADLRAAYKFVEDFAAAQ